MANERPDLSSALRELSDSRAERFDLARRLRQTPPDERAGLRDKIHSSRGKETAAKDRVRAILTEWIPQAPGAEVDRLSADHPIALLPVRLETRFVGQALKVRVYPDAIFANIHEPLLTDTERANGEAYHARIAGGTTERDAWSVLLRDTTPARAAYLAKVTDPAAGPAPTRPSDWGRFPECRALPDRWIVVATRGGEVVHRVAGRPIEQPLALAVRLAADGDDGDVSDTVSLTSDGLKIDRDLLWAFDYARAEEIGMAITLALTAADLQLGFDRVVVYGVKASVNATEGAARLRELLDAHHYTRGLAFVPQGTPTNNTNGGNAAYPPPDPDGTRSFAVERGAAVTAGDGVDLVRALGLPADVVAHVAGAGLAEQKVARAMNAAMWPVTWGYYLEQMMAPVASDSAVDWVHRWFVERVRGRGRYPAFRLGDVPYGLVPVSSLARWQAAPIAGVADVDHEAPARAALARLLETLRGIWKQALGAVPRVGRGDPDDDLIQSLALDASTRAVFLHKCLGRETQWNLLGFFGLPFDTWDLVQQSYARAVLAAIGHPEWDPRVLGLSFADQAEELTHNEQDRRPDSGLELVDAPPVREDAGLAFDYIKWIGRDSTFNALTAQDLPAGIERPRALLYYMLRHAMLEEYRRAGYRLLLDRELILRSELREPELVAVVPQKQRAVSVTQRMAMVVPEVTGDRTLAQFLDHLPVTRLADYRTSLRDLEGVPTAELERLFAESLDISSHRLDAWITSLVNERLERMRSKTPEGVHLGAVGWVEQLRPRTGDASPGGFVHAPSMNHAAAAAVLRSAYLTRSGAARRPYAVDLSSRRVRLALDLLDGVRQGQPLGALLGYRFERGLHEGHPGFELDKYIDEIRARYPLVANKGTPRAEVPPEETAENVAARNVVDGLALVTAFRDGTVVWGASGIPASGADRVQIEAELRLLDDACDCVADLLMTESVYQLVSGVTDAAGATLAAMAAGQRPPNPEMARTPRRASPFTQRFAILLGGDPLAGGAFHSPAATARAKADPVLNAWVGKLLGDPATVRCRVTYPDPTDPLGVATLTQPVQLSQLGIEPLDVLEMARGGDAATDSELDRRIAWVVGLQADAPQVRITYAIDVVNPATERSFLEVLEIARAINDLLAASRALAPEDLLDPNHRAAASTADRLPAELTARAAAAALEATQTIAALDAALAIGPLTAIPDSPPADLDPFRTALRRAALLGVSGAMPRSRTGYSRSKLVELFTQAESVVAELRKRQAAATAETDPVARLRALFGRAFLALPRFVPAAAPGFADALATAPLGEPRAADRWAQQVARVRRPMGARRRLELYARAAGVEPALRIVQMPHVDGASWIGGPLPASERPVPGAMSLILDRVQTPAVGAPWVGLLVDEWTEDLPDRVDNTGIVFHHDSPGAEAPQAVLLAVPPTEAASWNTAALEAVIAETIDLAKIRAVDAELVGVLGQMLPAIFLADNPNADTIATSFAGLTMVPGFLLAREG